MPERVGLMGTHNTGDLVDLQTSTMCSEGCIHQVTWTHEALAVFDVLAIHSDE